MIKLIRLSIISMISILVVGTGMLVGCKNNTSADLVVYGKIFTSENDQIVEAFAVKDGKYVYVGDKAGAEAYVEDGKTEVVDYSGKGLVMPGCGNGHAHYSMGYALQSVGTAVGSDVDPNKFLTEIVPAAVKKAKDSGATSVLGYGWRFMNFHDNMPTRQQLDAICSDLPIYFADEEGHKGLANTTLLVKAGIMKEDGTVLKKEIRGGEIGIGADGTPTGYLAEQAGTYVRNFMDNANLFTVDIAKANMANIQEQLLSEGYTMYLDGWSNYFFNTNFYQAAQQMDKAGDMHFVLGLSYEIESWMDVDKALANAADVKKYASTRVKPNWIKLFMDGTVETGTGFVEPLYPDGHQGLPNWEEEELTAMTRKANSSGVTMHVHVMGNKGVNRIVNAFINGGKDDMRNTLVHVYGVNEPDYQRMADHNIYVTGGMLWHHADHQVQEYLLSNMPEGLKDKGYPMKSYFDHGITMSSHSDFPATCGAPDDPFGIMEVAITGVLHSEQAKPWWTEELVTREQALTALTINVAKQMFIEDERGSIKEGKYADFLLVDKDVLTCPVTEIHEAKPVATYFEGKKMFSATDETKEDLIIKNAKIFTADKAQPQATAMVVKDGKFVYVGDEAGLSKYEGEVTDLGGRFVMPGIIDSHAHVAMPVGFEYADPGVRIQADGKKKVLHIIAHYVKKHPGEKRYKFNLEKRFLNGDDIVKEELDAICPNAELLILEAEQHSIWVNSKILKRHGITDETPDPVPGLSYYVRKDGHVTGNIIEAATYVPIFLDDAMNLTDEQIDAQVNRWIDFAVNAGVCCTWDAGVPGYNDFLEKIYRRLCTLDKMGKLPVYISGSYVILSFREAEKGLKELKRFQREFNTEHMKVHTMKVLMDGTQRIRTAAMVTPYEDTHTTGSTAFSVEELAAFLKQMNKENLDIHLHTVGERASRTVLDAVEQVRKELGDDFHIKVICSHIEIQDDTDLRRFAQLGVIANFTPQWHTDDPTFYVEWLGKERSEKLFRCKTVWDTGALVTWSSDEITYGDFKAWNPYLGMEIGMTRIATAKTNVPAYKTYSAVLPPADERMSIEEMLLGYTINGAKQLGIETSKGSIETGKDADFLVFDNDLLTAKHEGFSYNKPMAVYFSGKKMK